CAPTPQPPARTEQSAGAAAQKDAALATEKKPPTRAASACSDCPPPGYPTDKTRCQECPQGMVAPSLNPMNQPQDEITAEAKAIVSELHAHHPMPGNTQKAVGLFAEMLRHTEDRLGLLAKLRASHERWRAFWQSQPAGAFRPQLWRWLVSGDWEAPPSDEAIEGLSRKLPSLFVDHEAERKKSIEQRDQKLMQELFPER